VNQEKIHHRDTETQRHRDTEAQREDREEGMGRKKCGRKKDGAGMRWRIERVVGK